MASKKPIALYGGKLKEFATSDTVTPALLGTGTPDNTKYLRGDGLWAAGALTQWTSSGNDIIYSAGLVQVIGNAVGAAVSSTNGIQVANNTAATSSVQQWSPPIRRIGQGWKTNSVAASQTVEVRDYVSPVLGGTVPFLLWNIDSVINGTVVNILNYNSSIGGWTMPTSSLTVGSGNSVLLSTNGVITATQNLAVSGDGLITQHRVGVNVTSAGTPVFFSPRLRLTGAAWTGAASQISDWIVENQPVNGTTPITSKLVFSSQINAGGYNARMALTDTGQLCVGGVSPAASSLFDIQSTTKGSLSLPRMTLAQRTAIASPALGLHVYQTDGVEGVYVNKSVGWMFAY